MTNTRHVSSSAISPLQPGQGVVKLAMLFPSCQTVTSLACSYPTKLFCSPKPITIASGNSVHLLFLLTHGGGLVAGDTINLSIDLGPTTRLALVTQGSTKLYKSPDRSVISRQELDVFIRKGASICYLPDPMQPFRDSNYDQRQRFWVDQSGQGSLCLLDWLSEGRRARGESWNLTSWTGRNEVYIANLDDDGKGGQDVGNYKQGSKLLLRDVVSLEDRIASGSTGLQDRMSGLGIFGTVILYGPIFRDLAQFFLLEFSKMPRIAGHDWRMDRGDSKPIADDQWRILRHHQERVDGLLWTVSDVRGFAVIKFGARELEGARRWLGDMFRHQGSIMFNYGEQALLCLR